MAGHPRHRGLLVRPAAIQFQAEHDWPRVREECHELVRYARQAITDLTGLEPTSPDSREWYAQMATIPLYTPQRSGAGVPPCDAAELKRRLYEEHRVEVPIIEWGGRQFVRVSVQGYNTHDDIEVLVGALRKLLPKVFA